MLRAEKTILVGVVERVVRLMICGVIETFDDQLDELRRQSYMAQFYAGDQQVFNLRPLAPGKRRNRRSSLGPVFAGLPGPELRPRTYEANPVTLDNT